MDKERLKEILDGDADDISREEGSKLYSLIDEALRKQSPEYWYINRRRAHKEDTYEDIKNCLHYKGSSVSWNLNLFTGPKFKVACWDCHNWFQLRIMMRGGYPVITCVFCHAKNMIPVFIK